VALIDCWPTPNESPDGLLPLVCVPLLFGRPFGHDEATNVDQPPT